MNPYCWTPHHRGAIFLFQSHITEMSRGWEWCPFVCHCNLTGMGFGKSSPHTALADRSTTRRDFGTWPVQGFPICTLRPGEGCRWGSPAPATFQSRVSWLSGPPRPCAAMTSRIPCQWGYSDKQRDITPNLSTFLWYGSGTKIWHPYDEGSNNMDSLRVYEAPTTTGWWYTYPSETYESQLGWLFPIYGKS